MRVLNNIEITALREDILKKLKENRTTHIELVKEAREGYMKEAQKLLRARLQAFEAGVEHSLHFNLQYPPDHTDVYDTAIAMFEYDQNEHVKLNSVQVAHLLQDKWDWSHNFFNNAARFSGRARTEGISKGYHIE